MTDKIYVIDTSTIIDLFHDHPIDIYSQFWETLNMHFDQLLREGELILTQYVRDEIIHTAGQKSDGSDDPAVMWIKERKKYIIDLGDDLGNLRQAQKILSTFPESADIDKIPPAADPFLIAYVLTQNKQVRFEEEKKSYVIVTQERRNKNQNIEKLQKQKPPLVELTKIRSICDYYGIESMDYRELFRYEGWKF